MPAALIFAAHALLARQARSFAFDLPAAVADATPLFGPIGEREWSPEWAPHFLHPPTPVEQPGAVFTTDAGGTTRLWLLTAYDPAAGRVSYVVYDRDVLLTEIRIVVAPRGPHASHVTVTYRRSALTASANDQVDALTADWAAEQARHWGAATAAALARRE